jgi:hypothetical protein
MISRVVASAIASQEQYVWRSPCHVIRAIPVTAASNHERSSNLSCFRLV